MYDCERAIKIIHRLPAAALAFGTIALALQSIDRCKHPLYCAVWSALQSPFFFSIERPWFRELEALWLFSRLRKDSSSRLPAHSTAILFKRTHPIFLRREDMYAKTHIAMYLTDFGHHKPTGFDAETLRLSLSHDLAWSLAMADWDLLGELLMTTCYSLARAPAWQSICEAVLDAVLRGSGLYPLRRLIQLTRAHRRA